MIACFMQQNMNAGWPKNTHTHKNTSNDFFHFFVFVHKPLVSKFFYFFIFFFPGFLEMDSGCVFRNTTSNRKLMSPVAGAKKVAHDPQKLQQKVHQNICSAPVREEIPVNTSRLLYSAVSKHYHLGL